MNRLLEILRSGEHVKHVFDLANIPTLQRLIEIFGVRKHRTHGRNVRHIPVDNILVKSTRFLEHIRHIRHFARVPNTHRSVTRRTPIRRALTLNGGFLKTLLNGVHESGIIIRWKWFAIVPAFQRIRRIAPYVRRFIWISAKVVVANQSVRVRVRVFRAPIHARVPIFRLRLTPNVIDAPGSRNCFVARIFNRNLRARL